MKFHRRAIGYCKTLAWCALASIATSAFSAEAASSAADLRARYETMRATLQASPLGRPMELISRETSNGLEGEVWAVVDHPIDAVVSAFRDPAHWCEAFLLHINNRACEVKRDGGRSTIVLDVVRKADQPVADAFHLPFSFDVVTASPDQLAVKMSSTDGPLGTSNYRVALEAIGVDATHSFLHFSYAFDEGFLARTALSAYLATFGSSKVGFTVIGKGANGKNEFIGGTRGLVERNAMRYFLAVDSYLAVDEGKGNSREQALQREQAWFAASERYARQLHEIDRAEYLSLKRSDAERRAGRS